MKSRAILFQNGNFLNYFKIKNFLNISRHISIRSNFESKNSSSLKWICRFTKRLISRRISEVNDSRTKVLAKYFIRSNEFRNHCTHVLSYGMKNVRKIKRKRIIICASNNMEREVIDCDNRIANASRREMIALNVLYLYEFSFS